MLMSRLEPFPLEHRFNRLLSCASFVANSGVVLSLEEVESGLKGLKVQSEQSQPAPRQLQAQGGGTPFMAEHLEEALTGGVGVVTRPRDPDMSAFNKLVNCMKASGTLPTQPKASTCSVSVTTQLIKRACVSMLLCIR